MIGALRAILMAGSGAVVIGSMLIPGDLDIADSRKPANELVAARKATEKYLDVERAKKDGFVQLGECIKNSTGAVGYHYVNLDHVVDREIVPTKPEILIYHPSSTGLELVALEYFKRDVDQDLETDDDKPELFGEPFVGPIPGQTADQPIHYEMHIWLWRENPKGMFVHFNEDLHC
jgi:hypothetical protein